MVDFKSAAPKEKEDEAVVARNTRTALLLFAVYTAIYGGFMLLSAFAPHRMSEPFLGGVNLAVIYGFALIVAAIVLALVYVKVCRKA
jgi:uncharacterized membrane protein (DUF485 family)